MSEDIKIDVIRTTQNCLSKYIKKPPLTEKLLKKPPFRYIHDIVTSVMRETGFLQGLYSQEELNPENIKDREAKIVFLEKLVAAVNLSTGVSISARPNKIVAGLDVVKTNELLQTIAKALDKKIDSTKAVEQVLNKRDKGVSQIKKEITKERAGKGSRTNEIKTNDQRKADSLKKKTREKIKNVDKPEPNKTKHKKDIPQKKGSKVSSSQEEFKGNNNEQKEKTETESFIINSENKKTSSLIESDEDHQIAEPQHDVRSSLSPLPEPLNPLLASHPPPVEQTSTSDVLSDIKKEETKENIRVHGSRQKPDTEEMISKTPSTIHSTNDEDELKRPQSARAFYRKRSTSKQTTEQGQNITRTGDDTQVIHASSEIITHRTHQPRKEEDDKKAVIESHIDRESIRPRTASRPASARPGAPRVRDRGTVLHSEVDNKEINEPVNLIVDSKDEQKDDEETLVTVEATVNEVVLDQVEDNSHSVIVDQGHLVNQILETQKELEDTASASTASELSQKVDINWGASRQEGVTRELEKLRTGIQSLTRAVNPLGKLIDFLQEDVDSMQTELETWFSNNHQLARQLYAEERLTEESIEPLSRQLDDIEQLIEEQLEEMSVVKAAIIRNDERLTKLLQTNSSSSST